MVGNNLLISSKFYVLPIDKLQSLNQPVGADRGIEGIRTAHLEIRLSLGGY